VSVQAGAGAVVSLVGRAGKTLWAKSEAVGPSALLFFFFLSFLHICFISKFGLNMNFEFKHCANFYPPTIL
jgi:hypothetical protein